MQEAQSIVFKVEGLVPVRGCRFKSCFPHLFLCMDLRRILLGPDAEKIEGDIFQYLVVPDKWCTCASWSESGERDPERRVAGSDFDAQPDCRQPPEPEHLRKNKPPQQLAEVVAGGT